MPAETPPSDGGDGSPRVTVLSELPTPYRWPLFRRLLDRDDLHVRVLFYARTEADRDWDLDVDGTRGVEFLPGSVWHVRGRRSLFFHWNPVVWRRVHARETDVVVVPGWSMPTSLLAVLACRLRGIPYVLFSETHTRRQRSWWLRLLRGLVLRPVIGGASAWLATGSLSAEYLVEHGATAERIRRFANTPDVEALARAVEDERERRAETRAQFGLPADAFVTVHVGRLIGAKDVGTLLGAQARLEARGTMHWLCVVGDGVERAALEQQAVALGLARVRFLGALRPEQLPALWAAVDAFALASVHEPWGVVVNEAMAAGLPVLLSDRVGAAPDLVEPGVNGDRFPAGDDARLAELLRGLADDPDGARAKGRESARIVAEWGYGPTIRGFVEAVRLAAEEGR